jgi:hypothetical protein
VVVGWKQIPILFTLERLVEGGVVVNIKNVILAAPITYGGLMMDKFMNILCVRS